MKNCEICNSEMRHFTVRKAGPNQGRPFWSCTNKECDGFKWADVVETPKEEPAKPEVSKPTAVNVDKPVEKVPQEVWDGKDRRMVRMHTQKAAVSIGDLLYRDVSMSKQDILNGIKEIAHELEDDVYRE